MTRRPAPLLVESFVVRQHWFVPTPSGVRMTGFGLVTVAAGFRDHPGDDIAESDRRLREFRRDQTERATAEAAL